jgi:hypothetical protein
MPVLNRMTAVSIMAGQSAWQRLQAQAESKLFAISAFSVLFFGLALLVQWKIGAFSADLGMTGDEAAHFVTAAMIHDFLVGGHWRHPLGFALGYYRHFPRVAIGHWPPFFHLLQALVFCVAPVGVAAALWVQAAFAGLACGVPAAFCHHRWGAVAGLAAGLLVFLSPNFLFLLSTVMIDTLSGLLVLAAALAWARYWQRRDWGAGLWVAATCLCAMMTKGNALGLALLPPFHCALARDFGIFRLGRSWVLALLVGVVVVPWYAATYRLAASGFNYGFGWAFTSRALPFYALAMERFIGPLALAGVLFQAWRVLAGRERDPFLMSLLSATAAMFLFQALAPADLQPRYLLACLPCMVPVAVSGLVQAARRFGAAGAWLAGAAACVSIAFVFAPPHMSSFGMNRLAAAVEAAAAPNPLVLVCAGPNAEGAAIAAFAAAERVPVHYVLRGSQLLASGDFMGTSYRSKFDTPAALLAWIRDQRIGWVIVETSRASLAWRHDQMMQAVLEAGVDDWVKTASFRHTDGTTLLYRLPAAGAVPDGLAGILETIGPGTHD